MTAEQDVLREIEQSARLRPADVREARFSTTRFQPGYDEDEVDQFLDAAEAALAADLAALGGLRPSEVAGSAFAETRLRAGYNQDEVDAFVALVRDELTRRWNIARHYLGAAWLDGSG